MRIMAIDYGDARTGIAISDPTGFLAGFTTTIHQRDMAKVVEEIHRLAGEYQVEELVLGYPKNMNDSLGERAQKSRTLEEALKTAIGLPVILWDERRTTVDADRILVGQGVRGKKKKAKIDAVAAALILEGYLSYRQIQKGNQ
ncbi:MAG: Holliday junction resolvase RuvX [Oscillospiraceae bacterium]|jgi:putative Holliday junction resolvase